LLVDEESAKLPAAEPESGDLSEWMCKQPNSQ
jgi:hypothetical protein